MHKQNRVLARIRTILLGLSSVVVLCGCGDVLDVTNPGSILDTDLNIPGAMKSLVVGMSADYSVFLDEWSFAVARASDEMAGSGSYGSTVDLARGYMEFDMGDMDDAWDNGHAARFVAEDGLRRMQETMDDFNTSPLTARANLFAGLSNRSLGEAVCYAVIDGGGIQDRTVHFERALPFLEQAIQVGNASGMSEIVTAAYGIRAQAKVGLDDWAGAVADAAEVPTDFVYEAIFSDNSGRENNVIYQETFNRPEMSAYATYVGSLDPQDPRAVWTDCFAVAGTCQFQIGGDGETPHYRQEKYPERGSNIPVVKGTEMRLIEAEAALLAGDVTGTMDKINEVRSFVGVDPLTAASADEAWTHLNHERMLTLWLEGRRLWDLYRWDDDFLRGGTILELNPGINPRGHCVPPTSDECVTNVNLLEWPGCSG
jgi:hypothetical protein